VGMLEEMDACDECSNECRQQRAKETGRVVPMDLLEQALEQVPRSVKLLAPLVDYCAELLNAPNAKDIELVTEGETWETFYSQWVQ
jgi:hypothetical protein